MTMIGKRLAVTAVIGTVLAMTAACSSESGTGASSSAGSDGKKLTIGFAVPAANQTYWTAYINAVKAKASDLGVEVVFADAKDDANTQTEQVSSLIVSGVDGIVLVPTDTVGPKAAVAAAADAKIPLITSNRILETTYGGVDGAVPSFHVGFDDVKLGELQGEMLIEACGDKNPCNVVQLMATLGSSPQVQRTQGLDTAIEGHKSVTILDRQADNFDANKAVELTSTYLQKYDHIDVLVSQYDEMATAAARTIKEAGRSDEIKVLGLGGSKNGIDAVTAGTLLGTVWVSPALDGTTALESMLAVLKGDAASLTTEVVNGIPTVGVPATKVTKDNVANYPGEW